MASRASLPNRRLFFDIETSPLVALTWRIGRKIVLGPENVVRDRAIICVAWKWEGQKIVRSATWDRRQNDKALLRRFVTEMHKADEIVTHNGDKFDTPWLRTRCIFHGIPMAPEFTSIDTLKLSRSGFYFPSNRLDSIAKFLGEGEKIKTGFDLWKRVVLERDQAALNKMEKYCKHDVNLLERVWVRLNPYVKAKTHRGKHLGACPECGSEHLNVQRRRISAAGIRRLVLLCVDCGKHHTVAESRIDKRVTLNPRPQSACPHCGEPKTQVKQHRHLVDGHRSTSYQCQQCGRHHTIDG